MGEFAEHFEHEAADMMESIHADAAMSPSLSELPSLDADSSAQAIFSALEDDRPSLETMKRAGLHHGEAFEL